MTNEEAVKYFKRHIDLYCVTGICRDAEIMAIKALSQQTEYHGTEDMDGLYYCPICQQTTTVVKDGKCPKCGATMDELSTRAQQTEDAISREDALMVLTGEWTEITDEIIHRFIKRIKVLPSVTPKQRWFPVSERLPEEYGEYLITWTTSQSKRPFIGISEGEITSEYDHEHNRFKFEWLLEDYVKNYPDVKVLAWMPLPEPFEPQEREDKEHDERTIDRTRK